MNAAISAENQVLQHDNKQLSSLVKEYEQTLESVMSQVFSFSSCVLNSIKVVGAFRNRAVFCSLICWLTYAKKPISKSEMYKTENCP